ncbi:alpha-L-rhamnosidase-related protein [Parabacteroides pacaensis]|uniref:alpha-L-rhamnosidase-related protein n=1 Tax=Parabacteroides pacaensis TaxID=2086575 RepID=UPI000D0FF7E5|nr:family 78 glycoside hydrolase catalytic domain [Parabacteroides pacaensis]
MKKQVVFILAYLFSGIFFQANAQDPFLNKRADWLQKAEKYKPALVSREVSPQWVVRSIQDSSAFQGWRMEKVPGIEAVYSSSFKKQSGIILDFGEHLTGHFTFKLKLLSATSDAPIRFKFTFGEVPAELNTPFDPYPGGLSRAWLQDEIVTVITVPSEITIPRRLSFRYVKIELLGSSPGFDFAFDKITLSATTSVTNKAPELPAGTDPLTNKIYRIGLNTLKECMQTVYEDGPKRDLRLWIGDLYLEALANTYSYQNHDLTKRCLYLLAALADKTGWLHATVYESPVPAPQEGQHCMDYSLIYNVALLEYLKATGDRETALDLWPVVIRQIEVVQNYLTPELIYDMQKQPQIWLVFDWKDALNRHAPMQGLTIFALQKSYELATLLGKEKEVTHWPALIKQMKKAARKHFYDKKQGVIVSGEQRQVSYLSQAWMVLSETLNEKEGVRALTYALNDPNTCTVGSPYGQHYFLEALVKCNMRAEAKELMHRYWGGMVNKGADTFWEVYDPENDYLSPYNFFPINSYCHAWSCTPVYFINKYPEIFLEN